MALLTRRILGRLCDVRSSTCLSLYLPTKSSREAVRWNQRQFRAVLEGTAHALAAHTPGAVDPERTQRLLDPARGLLENGSFWRRQSAGLAVFIAPTTFQYFRLPRGMTPQLHIDTRLFMQPLWSLLAEDGYLWILALSERFLRLYQSSPTHIRLVDRLDIPVDPRHSLSFDNRRRTLRLRLGSTTVDSLPRASMSPARVHDAQSGSPALTPLLTRLDAAIRELIRGTRAWLVVAAAPAIIQSYHRVSLYPRLLPKGISLESRGASARQLGARAWSLAEQTLKALRQNALARWQAAASNGLRSVSLQEVEQAVQAGAVDTLFLADSMPARSPSSHLEAIPEPHAPHTMEPTAASRSASRVDRVAQAALRHGASLYVLPEERLPGGGPLAATFLPGQPPRRGSEMAQSRRCDTDPTQRT